MKKIVVLMLSLFVFFGVSMAQEISFNTLSGDHAGKGCIVPVEVVVDTKGKVISATDVMIESSMKYVDFVPSTLFPYFLPPVVRSNSVIHIVGFAVAPIERVIGSGVLGTLYLKAPEDATDGMLRLYFTKKGETSDSNLSMAGGVDVLESVKDLSFVFDQESCVHDAAVISGGFAGVDYQESLKNTMEKIQRNYPYQSFVVKNAYLLISSFILLVLIFLLVIYRKKTILTLKSWMKGRKIAS